MRWVTRARRSSIGSTSGYLVSHRVGTPSVCARQLLGNDGRHVSIHMSKTFVQAQHKYESRPFLASKWLAPKEIGVFANVSATT